MKETPSNFFRVKFIEATEMEHHRIEFILFFSVEFLFCGQLSFLKVTLHYYC